MAYTTINKSTDYFRTKLYSGNASNRSITFDESANMQPDLVWTKSRTNAEWHNLVDVVRGTTSNIYTNSTNSSDTASDRVTAFGTNGFSLGTSDSVNNAAETFVSWNWKAGNSQGSSNTDGSINTTYTSVNTTAGFSISSFTGTGANATVGHGLGVAPKVIITKSLANAENWGFYHESLGNGKQLELNTTSAEKTNVAYYNNTSPTSTVFSVGTADSTNDAASMVAYCFAEKPGYSKFGSYTGNGNNDGVFVYTGFKPSWLMIKKTNSTENWHIFDIKRNPYYPTSSSYGGMATRLMANLNNADDLSQGGFRFLSNGLKMTTSWAGGNGSGDTFIYMCFGQSIVGTNNIPATAR